MKTKLLRKLRKRFNWKFILKDDRKMMVIYDKKWNWIKKNYPPTYYEITDLEFLLDEFEDKILKDQYGRKKMKLKFDKL